MSLSQESIKKRNFDVVFTRKQCHWEKIWEKRQVDVSVMWKHKKSKCHYHEKTMFPSWVKWGSYDEETKTKEMLIKYL